MQELFSRLRRSQPLRYVFIGGVSYMAELSVLLFLTKALLLPSTLGVAISFWIGLTVSFVLQKYIAFESFDNGKKTFGVQALMYGVLVLFNYGFTVLFVGLFTGLLGLVAARTIALLFTVSWNYFVYKRIFKKS